MLPNHGFQVAHRFFHQIYRQTFDFAHMCAPVWVTTTHLGLPLPPITDWHTPHPPPGLVPCPSHSPITLGNPKVDSHVRTHTCAPDWGPIHPLPGRFLLTSGSQWLGSHYNTFLWGAHATRTACPPHSNHFCQPMLAFCSPMAEEPL